MSSKGIALVTGAAQGIGRAIALRLAGDGFNIAVNNIAASDKLTSLETEIVAKGRKFSAHVADVSVEASVSQMVDEVVDVHGGLDVMVANAGVFAWAPLLDATEDNFDHHYAINVKGTFFCYKYAGKQMIKQGRGGRIIGASSVAGKKGFLGMGGYVASKFAVRGLTQAAAIEFGAHKITVNAYAPGLIDTEMLKTLDEGYARTSGQAVGSLISDVSRTSALGHIGTPKDIASLVSYLASKEAHFITGQSVSCNGGLFFD